MNEMFSKSDLVLILNNHKYIYIYIYIFKKNESKRDYL